MSDSIIERLRHHAQDDRNTAFARSTMREVIDELAASRKREARTRDALIDCRTCRNYTRDGCIQTAQCVNGDGYRRATTVKFWSAALAEGAQG